MSIFLINFEDGGVYVCIVVNVIGVNGVLVIFIVERGMVKKLF